MLHKGLLTSEGRRQTLSTFRKTTAVPDNSNATAMNECVYFQTVGLLWRLRVRVDIWRAA